MAFTVVSDTGLEDGDVTANSYASVEFFLSYWAERGLDYSDYDAEAVQANLIKATDYIERRFFGRFKGRRLVENQSLSFPRSYLYNREGTRIDIVPPAVRKACAEYAARSLLGTALWSDPSVNNNIRRTSTSLGPISETIEYIGGGLTAETFPLADALLDEFLAVRGNVFR